MIARARTVLKEVFGYDQFRPYQEEILEAVAAGEDLLAVMPTGGGKSLCYQVPALTLGPEALVLVVSPLIALMREQVAFLRSLGVEARLLNSTLTPEEWRANAEATARGRVRLLYLAPETLASPRAAELLDRATVDLLAVDEAHCISEWGHDFRTEYRALGDIRKRLKPRRQKDQTELATANSRASAGASGTQRRRALVPCLALTATATERVRADIVSELGLRGGRVIVAGFDRPNIFLEVRRRARAVDQVLDLASAFPEGSGIVYCFSRARTEAFATDLSARGLSSLPYHAGLGDEERSLNQDRFIRDEVRVICATTAFGMGIDKPDVRFLVHADLPKSLEQYYQEVGRAGRDGLPAHALLLFSFGDAMKIRSLMAGNEAEAANAAQAEAALRGMLRFAESPLCRRASLLAHFGEEYGGPGSDSGGTAAAGCGSCDVCAPPPGGDRAAEAAAETDVTTQAYKLLSCVKRTGERYGAGHVVDVLVGSRNERVLGLGHSELSTWGIGKEWAKGQWLDLAAQLLRKGYLAKDEEYGVLSLTDKALAAFRDKATVLAAVPLRAKGGRDTASRDSGARDGASRTTGARPGAAATFAPGSREAALEEALRALRKRLAAEGKVPNYMIFSDRTLYELIAKKPADTAGLLGVFGMGEVKVHRFGLPILEAMARGNAQIPSAEGSPGL